jgi:hypothetical protein
MLSKEQIEKILQKVEDVSNMGAQKTSLWGMTYEEGVRDTIEWILEDVEDGYEGEPCYE